MSSWHFLLIVMTTDSVIFHWIWTGINVGNKLWVTVDPLFYLWPVLSLLWFHTVVWLSLLPADDHLWYQPLMTVYSGEWYPSSISVIPHPMSFLRTTHQNRYSPYVTFNTIRSVNITTMKQDLCMICDCSINNQQANNLFVINLSKGVLLVISAAFKTTLKYHLPTHSLCFLDTIIQLNQHHSTEYPKPCIDIIISPICNWNPTWHYPLHSINTPCSRSIW